MANTVKVRVPGTTANCGPGFDAIGIACSIYNELELTLSEQGQVSIQIIGEGHDVISLSNDNLILKAVQNVLDRIGHHYSGITLKMKNDIPLSRGLGSSAAAIVAGLVAANAATGSTLSAEQLLDMATAMEGHPDNVAPAIFGGITVSVVEGNQAKCLHFTPPVPITMVVAVPEFTLPTSTARAVLPNEVPLSDAVFNIGHAALLIAALCRGEIDYLKYALQDKLHQPYRQALIPGMEDVMDAAVACGALGVVISGAGPCLIAFTQQSPDMIGSAMVKAFEKHCIQAKYLVLYPDIEGATIIS